MALQRLRTITFKDTSESDDGLDTAQEIEPKKKHVFMNVNEYSGK